MNVRAIRILRMFVVGAVLAVGLSVGVIGVNPLPAEAAISSSVETIWSGTYCRNDTRTAYMNASIMLNQDRFPNGAWVWNRYRYYWVDGSGRPTTPVYATAWTSAGFVDTSSVQASGYGGLLIANSYTPLPGATMSGTGKVHVIPEVAVWNDSSYEYTSVLPNTYRNFYWSYSGGTWATTSFCQLSL